MMESTETQPKVLYEAHSIVRDHKDLGDAVVTWYRHDRPAPLYPYEKLINGYPTMDEAAQAHARKFVDGLFSSDEIEMLGVYLEKVHGIEIYLMDKRLPVKVDRAPGMKITTNPTGDLPDGGIWMLSTEKGYDLPFEAWGYCSPYEGTELPTASPDPDPLKRMEWLAREVFKSFPKDVTGLKVYALDCRCLYYRRIKEDGSLDLHVGLYRDSGRGPCSLCLDGEANWEDRVVDEMTFYRSRLEVTFGPQG